jgi:hypothetical protein
MMMRLLRLLALFTPLTLVPGQPALAQQPPPEAIATVRVARAQETRGLTSRAFQHLAGGADCPEAVFVSYAQSDQQPDVSVQWYQVSQIWADLALASPDQPLTRCWPTRGFTFLDRLWDRSQPTGGFFARADLAGEKMIGTTKWADDNSLAGLAWMEAANRAPDPLERELMLGRARATADFLMRSGVWDDTFGGGFWWNTEHGTTIEGKPAQTNALAAEFFLALYGMTGEPTYREWAEKTLAWMDQKLYDPNGQLYRWSVHFENLEKRQGEVVANRFFNYDQGIMIEAQLLANRVLGGDPRYLDRARSIGRRIDPVFWNAEHGAYNLEAGISQVFVVYSAWVSQSLLALYERDHDRYWLDRASANIDALNQVLWDPGNGGYFHSYYACIDPKTGGCENGASWAIEQHKHTVDQAWMERVQAQLARTLVGQRPFGG